MTFLLGLLVIVTSLVVLWYLVQLVFKAASAPTAGVVERWLVKRHVERARQADQLLADGKNDEALAVLRAAFYLTPVSSLDLSSLVGNHHSGIISRLLAITSEYQGGTVRLLALAKVDRLLSERRKLQSSYVAARQSPGPERTRELLEQLAENRTTLEAALQQLIAEVRTARRDAIYH